MSWKLHKSFNPSSREGPVRILLVDDSTEFLEVAASALSKDPRVKIAGRCLSGLSALEELDALEVDLVLMDVAMPEMNGLETTHHIKERPEPPRVIILSLYDDPDYRSIANAVGADAYVLKTEFNTHLLPLVLDMFPKAAEGDEQNS